MFHYHLPPELEGRVTPGSLVVVPFGQKQVQGVIWRMLDAPEVPETKAVAQLLDPEPALTPVQLALAAWMAHETLAPLAACFDLMLPPGLSQQVDILYQLNPPAVPSSGLGPLQTRLINLLKERGPLRGRQIDSYLQNVNWRAAAGGMKAKGWLATQAVLMPPSVRPKQVRSVRLAIPPRRSTHVWMR